VVGKSEVLFCFCSLFVEKKKRKKKKKKKKWL